MVTRRRKRRRGKKVYFLCKIQAIVEIPFCTVLVWGRTTPSPWPIRRLLPLTLSRPASCPLFFWLSFLQLSALILRRSPANRILFALRQDKHCPCVTPKTFHRLSHFQHGSDISIIGFFLLLKCSEETMRVKKEKRGAQTRLRFHFHQEPIKICLGSPPTRALSVIFGSTVEIRMGIKQK